MSSSPGGRNRSASTGPPRRPDVTDIHNSIAVLPGRWLFAQVEPGSRAGPAAWLTRAGCRAAAQPASMAAKRFAIARDGSAPCSRPRDQDGPAGSPYRMPRPFVPRYTRPNPRGSPGDRLAGPGPLLRAGVDPQPAGAPVRRPEDALHAADDADQVDGRVRGTRRGLPEAQRGHRAHTAYLAERQCPRRWSDRARRRPRSATDRRSGRARCAVAGRCWTARTRRRRAARWPRR